MDKLNDLYRKGALTEEEFQKEKQKLKEEDTSVSPQREKVILMGMDENRYMCLMNVILLFPSLGWLMSLALWIAAQNKSEEVNKQGKYILNWLITWLLFIMILMFSSLGGLVGMITRAGIGNFTGGAMLMIILSLIIGFLYMLFPILGAIKSMDGTAYRYPLSIKFLK